MKISDRAAVGEMIMEWVVGVRVGESCSNFCACDRCLHIEPCFPSVFGLYFA